MNLIILFGQKENQIGEGLDEVQYLFVLGVWSLEGVEDR